jgi:uncharacterized integral membrane protein
MTSTDGTPRRGDRPGGSLGDRITPRTIGVAVLVVLFIVWAVANGEPVEVDFIVVDTELRLFVALVLAGLLGAGAGYLAATRRRHPR